MTNPFKTKIVLGFEYDGDGKELLMKNVSVIGFMFGPKTDI